MRASSVRQTDEQKGLGQGLAISDVTDWLRV